MPLKAFRNPITVRVETIDHVRKSRTFKSHEGAKKFAVHYVGESPEVGPTYAVSFDGVATVRVEGCSLEELFTFSTSPHPVAPPILVSDRLMFEFLNLSSDLSPENLSCDGELSPSRTRAKYQSLMAGWRKLERKAGRTVVEDEVWDWYAKLNPTTKKQMEKEKEALWRAELGTMKGPEKLAALFPLGR